ncbi:hypothetical protein C248_0478 [Staphylococcus aureus 08BA02176]|nr:hypothetical protein C248_0478 [Staphylococcus aureus 08BA02176]
MLFFSPFTLSFNLIMFSTLFHVTNATPCDYRYQLFSQVLLSLLSFIAPLHFRS